MGFAGEFGSNSTNSNKAKIVKAIMSANIAFNPNLDAITGHIIIERKKLIPTDAPKSAIAIVLFFSLV